MSRDINWWVIGFSGTVGNRVGNPGDPVIDDRIDQNPKGIIWGLKWNQVTRKWAELSRLWSETTPVIGSDGHLTSPYSHMNFFLRLFVFVVRWVERSSLTFAVQTQHQSVQMAAAQNLKFTLNQFYAVNLSVQGHRLGSSHCGPKWNDQWNLQNLVPEGSCANSAFLFFYLWTNLSPRHVFWVEEMTRTSGGLR